MKSEPDALDGTPVTMVVGNGSQSLPTDASFPILTIIVFLPLVGAIAIAFTPRSRPELARYLALAASGLAWIASLVLVVGYILPTSANSLDPAGFQQVEQHDWIPVFGIQYELGVDGLSLVLVVLTTTLSWVSILASFGPIKERVKEYMVSFLILEVGMLGVFLSLDMFLFYIFWEIVLIPMYLIIGIWGGPRRVYATIKFVIYTLVGSLLMLVAILATAFTYASGHGGSFAVSSRCSLGSMRD